MLIYNPGRLAPTKQNKQMLLTAGCT